MIQYYGKRYNISRATRTGVIFENGSGIILCGKSYQCPVLGTRFGSTGTWYSPGPSAGEHHLPLVLVYHHDRRQVTSLLFFVVPTCL